MAAEAFIGASALLKGVFDGIAIAAGVDGFEAFPVNPNEEVLEHVRPVSSLDEWTKQFIGLQCSAGDQTFIFDTVNEKAWSQQTDWYREGMTEEKMARFMQEYCAPTKDVPIS